MDATLRELFDLFLRWLHLIAGIMWIGNSMLFNWLDRNLKAAENAKEGHIGEMWWLHGGGFYQVEKKTLKAAEMPALPIHWFKWQSYTTWISGFFLLAVVYYMGKGLLVDPTVMALSHGTAVAIGLGVLVGGFFVYDLMWRSPLKKLGPVAVAISFVLLVAVAYGLTHVFSARAAFLHVGALLGTCMAGNVFFHIIPNQKIMMNALYAGQEADYTKGAYAKQRSIHNNYITFPMLFLMLSNHFPSVYGHPQSWLLLAIITLGGAVTRHFMNIRYTFKAWKPAMGGTIAATAIALLVLIARPAAAPTDSSGAPVAFQEVQTIIAARCATCHATKPTDPDFPSPPLGVVFDTPEQIKAQADRIVARSVTSTTMPLANKTQMTQAERELVGRWVAQGAHL